MLDRRTIIAEIAVQAAIDLCFPAFDVKVTFWITDFGMGGSSSESELA